MITKFTKMLIFSVYAIFVLTFGTILLVFRFSNCSPNFLSLLSLFVGGVVFLTLIFIVNYKIAKYKIEDKYVKLSENYSNLKYKGDLILNSIIEGVCWLDKRGNIIFANKSARYILGYIEDHEIIGKNFHSLVHKTEKEAGEKCAVELTLNKGTCNIFRNENFYRKDGKAIPVAVFTSPIIENNQITGAVVTFIDLTHETKQKEEIKKYQTIIEQASMVVVITDKEGRIEYVNPTFEKITGYSRLEVIGKNPKILKSGKHPKSFYEHLWKTILSGNTWDGEFINKKKDGTFYYEEASIFPIKDAKGKITNFVAIKKDITKTKELEDLLHQAQKLEAIGRLTGGIAHDFNNLLTIISGYTEILQNMIHKDDRRYVYLEKVIEGVNRASELVNKLLAFSRKQPINPKPLDLVLEVKNLEKMLKRLIPEDIILKFSYNKDSIIIFADPTQIEQILINLIVNARDAIYEKKEIEVKVIEVSIGTEIYKNKEFAKISVKDNGTGIPEEIKKKIFEPFFTTKKAGTGTGLGLSTVYGIVMQNGGEIKIHSKVNEGTCFSIYLPLYEEKIKKMKEDDKVSESVPEGNEKILIVEDEKEIRNLIKNIFSSAGYKIFEAKNGLEALYILKEKNFDVDLVISDLVMPEMDGVELYKEVKTVNPKIKFLFITGYSDDILKDKGIISENVEIVRKPFNFYELGIKVRKILS